ncbi:MAG: hypothetical protein AAF711_00600 [Planctomycetota bacterium]
MHESIKTYAKLARRRHDYQRKIDQIEAEMAAAEKDAMKAVAKEEDGTAISYGMSLTARDDVKVRAANDTADIVAALRSSRKPELIGVNWPALIAYVKDNAGKLPAALSSALKVTPKQRIDARRAARN